MTSKRFVNLGAIRFEPQRVRAYVGVQKEGANVELVIFFAVVAGFLALRLYAVLGKRTGHEQALPRANDDRATGVATPRMPEGGTQVSEIAPLPIEARAEQGLRTLIAAEPSFDPHQFLDGAKSAYRMVLEAFWKGDRETLNWLVDDEVRDSFFEAIDAREAAGETLENRLIGIERAVISDVTVAGDLARVTVRFDADIAAVTRDKDGTVIAGSLSDAVETHDVWTFSRALRSSDPNWKLSDTDEA